MSREDDDLEREFADIDDNPMAETTKSRLRPIPLIVLGVAAVAFVAIVWYAYNQGVKSGSEGAAPLLKPEGEAKVAPEDEGGLKIPNQDKKVYDRITGEEDGNDTVENILPPPEEPETPPQDPETAPETTAETETVGVTPPEAEPELPDPELPDPELAAPAEEPPTATDTVEKAAEEAEAVTDGTAEEEAKAEAEAQIAAAAEKAKAEAKEAAEAAAQTTAEAAEQTAEQTAARTVGTDSWRVQLAALRSADAAKDYWNRVKKAQNSLLGDLALQIQEATVNDVRYFRVRGGPLADKAAADALCAKLKAKDIACLPVRPGK